MSFPEIKGTDISYQQTIGLAKRTLSGAVINEYDLVRLRLGK